MVLVRKFFRAIDLFAGIGGIRLGFELAFKKKIRFLYTNEVDPYCIKTYKKNFANPSSLFPNDILDINLKKIPNFDILLAGFPCQAFSMAGKKRGFDDKRGMLFYKIVDILKLKRPLAFMLENVKHLKNHNNNKTFMEIRRTFEEDLDYKMHYNVIDAVDYGLPQKRKRIYIVGFKEDVDFRFPIGSKLKIKMQNLLEKSPVDIRYYLSQQYLDTLKKHKARHKAKGHGFGYQVIPAEGIANTLVCGGMGLERNLLKDIIFYEQWKPGENPLKKKNTEGIRKLTEREFARLQGFPDSFKFPVSMTQTYRQVANSVPIPVVKAIALEMKRSLELLNKSSVSSIKSIKNSSEARI